MTSEADRFFGTERAQVIAADLRFRSVDLTILDDRALAAQVADGGIFTCRLPGFHGAVVSGPAGRWA